jgi:O-6-methylguanine DNA methyltransferase
MNTNVIFTAPIETPLGVMVAISDAEKLYLLDFIDPRTIESHRKKLDNVLNVLQQKSSHSNLVANNPALPIRSIQKEIAAYFNGTLTTFTTPIHLIGTSFQKTVWQELCNTPYGHTRSYKEQAEAIGNEKAYRAVGSANGANPLAIIVPCHRIVTTDHELGGYSSGLARKQWLLEHEKSNLK